MWPAIAAAISGVASIVGGKKADKANRAAEERATALQKEFAQHGVRWRVEDAKAAGLHPLYALQAQGLPQASPVVFGNESGPALAQAGQNAAQFLAAKGTRQDRMLQAFSLKAAEQSLREGDARINLLNAEAALAHQQAMASKGMPDVNVSEDIPGFQSAKKVNPLMGMITPVAADLPGTEVDDPSRIAGTPAMWRQFRVGDMDMVLPGGVTGDASEALESVTESIPAMWMVLRENVRRFGKEWLAQWLDTYGFQGLGRLIDTPSITERETWDRLALPGFSLDELRRRAQR